jgi:hypothetical protein
MVVITFSNVSAPKKGNTHIVNDTTTADLLMPGF